MNRSQFVFVIVLNALISVLITSTILILYEWRRPQPDPGWWLAPENRPLTAPATVRPVVTTPAAVASAPEPGEVVTGPGTTDPEDLGERTYTVREGDSLSAIAALFGVTQSALAAANGITDPNLVTVGQTLVVPIGDTSIEPANILLTAADFGLEVLNAGTYAEEVVVIINQGQNVIDLSGWSIHTSLDEQYTFKQMFPLYQGESVRLMSREGTDTAYDKNWGRLPTLWVPGTIISLRDPSGAEVLNIELP